MKNIPLLLASLALVSCAAMSSGSASGTRAARGTPELSVVHLSGKITDLPAHSKWPASIQVGTPFDYWAVIDNRVPDTSTTKGLGSYVQKAWPARYDFKVGSLVFSSNDSTPSTFQVQIQDEKPGYEDGYFITSNYGSPFPGTADLSSVSWSVQLVPQLHSAITSKSLPLHRLAVSLLTGGAQPHFRAVAHAKNNPSDDQTLSGKADAFEVFQGVAEP